MTISYKTDLEKTKKNIEFEKKRIENITKEYNLRIDRARERLKQFLDKEKMLKECLKNLYKRSDKR